MVAAVVDSSLVRDKDTRISSAIGILDEMAFRGNLIAEYHKLELEQLGTNIATLEARSEHRPSGQTVSPTSVSIPGPLLANGNQVPGPDQANFDSIDTLLSEWNSEDGLSSDHLLAVADSLDFGQLNWLATGDFENSMGVNFPSDGML